MQFLAKFFNQPALWAWSVVMILVIGLLVYKTPGLLMVKGGASLFGAWVEAPEVSYADSGIPNNQSFFVDVLTNYPTLSGIKLMVRDANGALISQTSAHYSFLVGLLVIAGLLAAVVIFTRQSVSAIYILGPLLVGLIATMIMTVKFAGGVDYTDTKISLDVGGAIFDWGLLYGGAGVAIFIVTKYLIRQGLIRGIDEEGPLDFSRLQQAAVTTTGQTMKTVGVVGDKLQRAIGDNSPNNNVASVSQSSAVAEKPRSRFLFRHCIYCGGNIRNGKCQLCQNTINNYVVDPAYGLCSRCDAPKAARAKNCYNCGLLFENEPDHSYAELPPPGNFCQECGRPQTPEDKFCKNCGTRLAVPQN